MSTRTCPSTSQDEQQRMKADEADAKYFVDTEWPADPTQMAACLGTPAQREALGWGQIEWRRAWALLPRTEEVHLFASIEPSDVMQACVI